MRAELSRKVKTLLNLLERGRRLHYENARFLVGTRFSPPRGRALPTRAPPIAELVYRAGQIVCGFTLMEQRRYLDDDDHDAFTDAVFRVLAEDQSDRLFGLVQAYGAAFPDERRFVDTVSRDLAAALMGEIVDDEVVVLSGAPRAVLRMSRFYVAQTFGDRELMKVYG